MSVAAFREMAIHSAQLYYSHLERSGKGIAEIPVRRIKRDGEYVQLHLGARLSDAVSQNLDGLLFRWNGRDYTSNQIVPIEYTPSSVCLQVRPKPKLLRDFCALEPSKLTVYSDLKFLVKRVEEWYTCHGHRLALPEGASGIARETLSFSETPSQEQEEAVFGALSCPFSYIWGAPGTGKTRVVLASCVLSLLASNRKVLLIAPTNNALEQMLMGILPSLSKAGIPLDKVIRLGLPSASFSSHYPSVCERLNRSEETASITSEIKQIKKCLSFRNSYARFLKHTGRINTLLGQYACVEKKYWSAQSALDQLHRQYTQLFKDAMVLHAKEIESARLADQAQSDLTGFSALLKKWFSPRVYSALVARAETQARALQAIQSRRDYVSSEISTNLTMTSDYEKSIASLSAQKSELKDILLRESAFWPDLEGPMASLLDSFSAAHQQSVLQAIQDEGHHLDELSRNYARYDGQSDAELSGRLEHLSQKLQLYDSTSSDARLADTDVVAATIDKFLTLDFTTGPFQPNHIFLDEAGYCAFIKGACVLSLGVPVTLLGDHMQLPPVCEMDDSEMESSGNQDICIWAQSAIHMESIFTMSPEEVAESYFTAAPPAFTVLQNYTLTCTYRFGSAISNILSGYVYDTKFHSAFPDGTQLLVLHAPHGVSSNRISLEEIDVVAQYLAENPLDDFAILSPYRNQVAQFAKRFPSLARESRTLTVHASQGREWNTVFFSVSDTTHMWLTNSRLGKSKGLQVINTAVSRAKKRLILVCDYDCWSRRNTQLIGQLVSAAEKLN